MECPSCGSENVVKRGRRKNKYTTKQMYWCKDCQKKFIQKDGFENMTYPPELITKVLHLRAEGMSLAGIRDYIYQHEGYYLYDSTILYWTRKYAKRLSQYERKQKPKIKGKVHVDEIFLKVKGKQVYDINTIDGSTGYNLGRKLTDHRSKDVVREFFKKFKMRFYDQIMERYEHEKRKPAQMQDLITIVSDGFEGYKDAFDKYLSSICKLVHGVPIAYRKYGLDHNNNPAERYNEDIRQRSKISSGFESMEPTDATLELRRIFHNFSRLRRKRGGEPKEWRETPAERSGIELEFGRDRLMALINFLRFLLPRAIWLHKC
jgi:transposase-like protein